MLLSAGAVRSAWRQMADTREGNSAYQFFSSAFTDKNILSAAPDSNLELDIALARRRRRRRGGGQRSPVFVFGELLHSQVVFKLGTYSSEPGRQAASPTSPHYLYISLPS